MNIDNALRTVTLGGYVLRSSAFVLDCFVAPCSRVFKKKMLRSIAKRYMLQLFLHQFERTWRSCTFISFMAQGHRILDKRSGGLSVLAKIIRAVLGNDHLRLEAHLFVEMATHVMEQPAYVSGFGALISHRKSRIKERPVGESAQEY